MVQFSVGVADLIRVPIVPSRGQSSEPRPTRRLVRRVLLGALGLLTVVAPPIDASPVTTAGDDVSAEDYAGLLAQLVPEPTALHPSVLAQVSLDLGPVGRLADDILAAHTDLVAARATLDAAQGRLEALDVRARLLGVKVDLAEQEESDKRAARDHADLVLSQFAVSTFVDIEDYGTYFFGGDQASQVTLSLANRSADITEADAVAARSAHDEAVADLAALRDELAEVEASAVGTAEELVGAEAALETAREARDALAPRFERALLQLTVPGTDIPVVVLDAYYRAQVAMASQNPACGVTWWHLAGIGKAESSHGSFGGNVVGGDGRTSGEIIGPPLDGTRFSAIPDTDGGELDGNDVWDHAVGPMQFIPTSWAIYGADGNDDGLVDPHNIYDAALAAARHLCGSTSGLDADGAFQFALLGYNQSATYGLEVMGYAATYQLTVGLT